MSRYCSFNFFYVRRSQKGVISELVFSILEYGYGHVLIFVNFEIFNKILLGIRVMT